jgi:GNAT superfamily N-acetyltransferase
MNLSERARTGGDWHVMRQIWGAFSPTNHSHRFIHPPIMTTLRLCRADERETIFDIINEAAEVYRGAIPEDCWHEPYMSHEELDREIAEGVVFWGSDADGALAGVMGIQRVKDVDLVRHAYVRPAYQGRGIGAKLLAHLESLTSRPVLIGTWKDAAWAIRFYQNHGFRLVAPDETKVLLKRYWNISDRQLEVSVVLAREPDSIKTST